MPSSIALSDHPMAVLEGVRRYYRKGILTIHADVEIFLIAHGLHLRRDASRDW